MTEALSSHEPQAAPEWPLEPLTDLLNEAALYLTSLEPAVRKVLSERFVDSDPELVEDVIRGVALSNLEELIQSDARNVIAWWTAPERLDGDEPPAWRGGVRRTYPDADHVILRREEAAND